MPKKKIIELLTENINSDLAKKIANKIGLQVVHRGNTTYLRRKPKRLTGKALNSAIAFAKINHKNRGKEGVVLLPNGEMQNIVAYISAKEMKGKKFVDTIAENEKIKAFVEKYLDEEDS